MSGIETIGVVGAGGDLGSRFIVQACNVYDIVPVFDVTEQEKWTISEIGIDPKLKTADVAGVPVIAGSLNDLIESSETVHWCAPAKTAIDLDILPDNTTLVLHDSVMRGSLKARRQLLKKPDITGKIVVAHCLMNDKNRVEIASDIADAETAFAHFEDLGLSPHLLTSREHDKRMAQSQGLAALMIAINNGNIQNIEELIESGDLTPSGERFLEGLSSQDAKWTDATKDSILTNRELAKLVWKMSVFMIKRKLSARTN